MVAALFIGTEIVQIPLDQIQLDICPDITEEFLKRMLKNHSEWLEYDLLLAVEPLPSGIGFRLVGGFDRYIYLKKYTKFTSAHCIIEKPSPSMTIVNFKILRRFFNRGEMAKSNKFTILRRLQNAGVNIVTIVKNTGFTRSLLENEYMYKDNIPEQYRFEGTSIKTLNWIATLTIPPFKQEIIEFLYERANENDSTKRLTQDCIIILQKLFISKPAFFHLLVPNQKKILTRAINFKGNFLQLLIKDVDELL